MPGPTKEEERTPEPLPKVLVAELAALDGRARSGLHALAVLLEGAEARA